MDNISNKQKLRFKRIARIVFGQNKHLVISLASNNTITMAQFGIMELDGGVQSVPMPGTFRIAIDQLINIHHLFTWVILHLDRRNIPQEDRAYVEKLREISSEPQKRIEEQMKEIGFPPTQYQGQSFEDFDQQCDQNRFF